MKNTEEARVVASVSAVLEVRRFGADGPTAIVAVEREVRPGVWRCTRFLVPDAEIIYARR